MKCLYCEINLIEKPWKMVGDNNKLKSIEVLEKEEQVDNDFELNESDIAYQTKLSDFSECRTYYNSCGCARQRLDFIKNQNTGYHIDLDLTLIFEDVKLKRNDLPIPSNAIEKEISISSEYRYFPTDEIPKPKIVYLYGSRLWHDSIVTICKTPNNYSPKVQLVPTSIPGTKISQGKFIPINNYDEQEVVNILNRILKIQAFK